MLDEMPEEKPLEKKPFEGKKALVVGGTGGIGAAISLELAKNGANLYMTGHYIPARYSMGRRVSGGTNTLKAEMFEQKLREYGVSAQTLFVNLRHDTVAEEIANNFRDIDILVCAYGPFLRKYLAETSIMEWRNIVHANLTLPGALISSYLGGMIERGWGRILLFGGTNTSNIRGFTTTCPYSASKTALAVLAKSVAKNVPNAAVTCNVISPGLTDTEYMDEEAKQYNRDNAPGGKVLSPAEIAAFAIEIMKNPALNGAVFPIDYGVEVSVV